MASIVYACIAESSGIIVAESQNPIVDPVIDVLLENIDFLIDHKKSFAGHPKTKGHTIQYLVDDEICYLSAASDGFPQRICFAFLEKLRTEYKENYQGHNKNQAFKKFLAEQMNFYSHNPEADKLSALKVKVAEVTDIMHENVEKLLERGDVIEGIENKAEDLRVKTSDFDKQAKRLRCAMCQENCKAWICLILTVVVVLTIVAGVVAGLVYLIFFSGVVL